jgi:hypothetical protein
MCGLIWILPILAVVVQETLAYYYQPDQFGSAALGLLYLATLVDIIIQIHVCLLSFGECYVELSEQLEPCPNGNGGNK